MICHTRLWYYFSNYVQKYFTQREVLNLPLNTVLYYIYSVCCINVRVGVLWCISPLLFILENIYNIVKNGGGLCGENIPIY